MSLSNASKDPVDDDDGKSAKQIDDQRDRLGKNLLSIGDAVIVTDALGNVILLNPAAESLTGWTDYDARNRPIDDSASLIRDEKGDLDAAVLIFRDTTERSHVEKQREQDRRHGEVIIAVVQNALLVLDGNLRVRSANRSFYETFHTSPEETINRSLFDLGDGQWNIDGLRALLEDILTRNTSFSDFQVERAFPTIGSRIMHINARKFNGKDGREMMILLAIEDITERSQMANSLAASEVRFRRLFEAAKDGILILDANTGAITDANPFLLDLLGYSCAELLGKHLWDIGLLGNIDASRASFRELQEKGYVRYEDLPLETKDGRHVEVEFVSNVYRVNDQMIIQCNIRDITARKRAEEEVRQVNEANEVAGRAKDRFLATLSHELRTPLTPVLTTIAYVQMMPNLASRSCASRSSRSATTSSWRPS